MDVYRQYLENVCGDYTPELFGEIPQILGRYETLQHANRGLFDTIEEQKSLIDEYTFQFKELSKNSGANLLLNIELNNLQNQLEECKLLTQASELKKHSQERETIDIQAELGEITMSIKNLYENSKKSTTHILQREEGDYTLKYLQYIGERLADQLFVVNTARAQGLSEGLMSEDDDIISGYHVSGSSKNNAKAATNVKEKNKRRSQSKTNPTKHNTKSTTNKKHRRVHSSATASSAISGLTNSELTD